MILGTNDQTIFARLDARKDVSFSTGETRQFNMSNSGSYRWYYLYLQDGFSLGNDLEFHLNEISPQPAPVIPQTPGTTVIIKRAPVVVIFGFNQSAVKVDYYTFTSSETLVDSQSWQLLGTNDPNMLGSSNAGAFTVLDVQSSIGFAGGVPKQFNVASPSDFSYYVIYLQSGFYVAGMNLEIHLHETPPAPTPTPTSTPTPPPTPRYYIKISGGGEGAGAPTHLPTPMLLKQEQLPTQLPTPSVIETGAAPNPSVTEITPSPSVTKTPGFGAILAIMGLLALIYCNNRLFN